MVSEDVLFIHKIYSSCTTFLFCAFTGYRTITEYLILSFKVPVFYSVLQNSYYFRPAVSLLLPSVLHNLCYFLLSCIIPVTSVLQNPCYLCSDISFCLAECLLIVCVLQCPCYFNEYCRSYSHIFNFNHCFLPRCS